MITTIIFDLSDVYIKGLVGAEKYIQKSVPIKTTIKDIFISQLDQLFRGEISEDLYWQAVIDKNNWDIKINDLKKAVRHNFREIKGTKEIIMKLRNQGYKLGLLSIHAREWVEYCNNAFDYHKLFDFISYSFDTGILKPKKKAYLNILENLNANPQECVFIDDNYNNIVGSMKLGIISIQFRNAKQLEADLIRLGVKIQRG